MIWSAKKWKSWRSNLHNRSKDKKRFQFHWHTAQCNNIHFWHRARVQCLIFYFVCGMVDSVVRIYFSVCCHAMTMAYDDLLIVIFHLFCTQSMCECSKFMLPKIVSLKNISERRSVAHRNAFSIYVYYNVQTRCITLSGNTVLLCGRGNAAGTVLHSD